MGPYGMKCLRFSETSIKEIVSALPKLPLSQAVGKRYSPLLETVLLSTATYVPCMVPYGANVTQV